MIMVLVMEGELAQLLSVKFAAAVGTDPRKEFECLLASGLFPMRLMARRHVHLGVEGDV